MTRGRDVHSLVDLMGGFLRRVQQFNSRDYMEYAMNVEASDCPEVFGLPELDHHIAVEEILEQTLLLLDEVVALLRSSTRSFQRAITPPLQQSLAGNFAELVPLMD